MIIGPDRDIFSARVSALNSILFYLLEGLPLAFLSGSANYRSTRYGRTYNVAGGGLHFFRRAMNRQILKASQAAQNAAGLVLRKRIAGFGLGYSVVKLLAYFGQTDLLKRGIGSTR